MDPIPAEDETLDTFYHGRVRVLQKKHGYRFSVDAPLLADFILTHPRDELLELGSGNGIIPLLLSLKPFRHITALEIQESLYDLALRNVRLNRLESRITVLRQDLIRFGPPHKFDVVFSNPPYLARGSGHVGASPEKAVAKHEIKCDISDIMRVTAERLKSGGRAFFIYPFARRRPFFHAFESRGLRLRRERPVLPYACRKPNLFLTELGFGSVAPQVESPLVLFDEDGEYTGEARDIFAGRGHAATSD